MDDHQKPEAGSVNLSQTDVLGHVVDYSRAKREFLKDTSSDTSDAKDHSRKKRKVQPEDSERGMQDGVAACSNVFNASPTGNDDDITHSNADRNHKGSSNGTNACLKKNEKPRCVLVCPKQDKTDDQETENYHDGFCHITIPITYFGQTEEEKMENFIIGSDFIVERGVIHFWRVEGKKDLAHFMLLPLPRLDWGIGEDPELGLYEGPLLTMVEKRWPKNKGDKVIVIENPDRIATASGIYAIVDNGEGSHLAYHIASASRSKGSASLSSLGVRIKGPFICWVKNPKASGTDIDKPCLYWKWLQEEFRGLLWTSLVQEHLVMEGTEILLIRGNPKNEKVKEDNSEEELNDAEISAEFEKELIELDYAGLDIAPLEDDHPVFEFFKTAIDEFSIQWYPWEWMRPT